ncbi:2-polyprenylphenol 6-hydroxylase [Caulobacter vibrioides]|uniref:2-polyprenylphenol 6-hydroxylase n=1 Tax=Caulobacter vibrioides TaxID=155892 RepID=UPI000BB51656|nr:2-polyprenylphenol 6-hydroxylase [Caulobacter vibrioides]ATC26601.1 2-polyprenylphenol 6-hydroxylase [Caulobacter vibrioides]AZH14689.1 2-polyprenylphenol 6-hydroxylase [Caulobacter vibrioides]PLR12426.1 2-polyprenylphenol 6-hydroxylase [Caulobacter vibrioides]
MATLEAFWRLTGAGWALVRADALIPRELEPLLPPSAKLAGRVLRLFAGPAARKGRPGERLAAVLERQGPAAIKMGQFLSTRADIFGAAFADDLSRLKDRLPAFPLSVARAEIARNLGKPLDEIFAEIGEPVAAASLAQAHPATLVDGQKVAVKVLRPGVERQVARDTAVLRLAARLAETLVPASRRLRPTEFVEVVIRALELEMDLRFEAAGCAELGEAMAKDPYMRAPAVCWEGVGKRVLTLSWAEGAPLSGPAALDLPGLDRKALAENVTRGFLAQALDHGLFHADLHEGNLFIAAPAAITAVDYGIVGRLGPGERRYLAEILYGFLNRDYARVAKIHFDAGYVPAHQDMDAFAQALRAVGEPVFGRKAREVSMGRLLAQLFEITALFDMALRPELVLLQKTMVTVEGVARRIDPTHDLWAAADPVVRRWIGRELSPAAKARDFAEEAIRAIKALARLAETPTAPPPVAAERLHTWPLLWFLVGAATAGAAFVTGVLLAR